MENNPKKIFLEKWNLAVTEGWRKIALKDNRSIILPKMDDSRLIKNHATTFTKIELENGEIFLVPDWFFMKYSS